MTDRSRTLLAVALLLSFVSAVARAAEKPFEPLTKSIYSSTTRRDILDLEIPRPNSGTGEALRLRIERSYVSVFLYEPSQAILSMLVNRPTGLPQGLFDAVSVPGRWHEDIAGYSSMSPAQRAVEAMIIGINSSRPASQDGVVPKDQSLCPRSPDDVDLELLSGPRIACRGPYPDGKQWIGSDDEGRSVRLMCPVALPTAACELTFPFMGYAAIVSFAQSERLHWKEIRRDASEFMRRHIYSSK